ncbi:MAG: MraZ protein [Actinomycetota bacterium]
MEGFVGRYERQLDPKGRVALPSTFRNRLEPRCYLTLGSDKCIGVVTAAVSMEMAEEMMAAVKRGEKTRSELRALAVNMVEVQVDAQGRITLDENLRTYAGLSVGARVVVSGAFDSVEIWEPERFERMLTAGTEAIAGDEQ